LMQREQGSRRDAIAHGLQTVRAERFREISAASSMLRRSTSSVLCIPGGTGARSSDPRLPAARTRGPPRARNRSWRANYPLQRVRHPIRRPG
jgi:hypothetical protein